MSCSHYNVTMEYMLTSLKKKNNNKILLNNVNGRIRFWRKIYLFFFFTSILKWICKLMGCVDFSPTFRSSLCVNEYLIPSFFLPRLENTTHNNMWLEKVLHETDSKTSWPSRKRNCFSIAWLLLYVSWVLWANQM